MNTTTHGTPKSLWRLAYRVARLRQHSLTNGLNKLPMNLTLSASTAYLLQQATYCLAWADHYNG